MTTAEEHAERTQDVPAPSPTAHLVRKYRDVKEGTTPADEVLILLLDGTQRFVEQAREALQRSDFETKNTLLCKAQRIILELASALDPSIGDQVFRNLRGLYFFVYRRLVEANVNNDEKALEEGQRILGDLCDLWREAVSDYREALAQPRANSAESTHETESDGLCLQC